MLQMLHRCWSRCKFDPEILSIVLCLWYEFLKDKKKTHTNNKLWGTFHNKYNGDIYRAHLATEMKTTLEVRYHFFILKKKTIFIKFLIICATKCHSIPERTTISWVVKPLLEKRDIRASRSEVGAGRSELAVLKLAVVESLLPNCTVHVGPPNWKHP